MGTPNLTFDALRSGYAADLENMEILTPGAVHRTALHLVPLAGRYAHVSGLTGVPVCWLLCIDYHESGNDPRTYLGNGDPVIGTGRKTLNVPGGRGPFEDWDSGALDALASLKGSGPWTQLYAIWQAERWNGFGYRRRGVPSAYLWGSTSVYKAGGFPRDGVWDPNYKTKQIGIVPLLQNLGELDEALKLPEDSELVA